MCFFSSKVFKMVNCFLVKYCSAFSALTLLGFWAAFKGVHPKEELSGLSPSGPLSSQKFEQGSGSLYCSFIVVVWLVLLLWYKGRCFYSSVSFSYSFNQAKNILNVRCFVLNYLFFCMSFYVFCSYVYFARKHFQI